MLVLLLLSYFSFLYLFVCGCFVYFSAVSSSSSFSFHSVFLRLCLLYLELVFFEKKVRTLYVDDVVVTFAGYHSEHPFCWIQRSFFLSLVHTVSLFSRSPGIVCCPPLLFWCSLSPSLALHKNFYYFFALFILILCVCARLPCFCVSLCTVRYIYLFLE